MFRTSLWRVVAGAMGQGTQARVVAAGDLKREATFLFLLVLHTRLLLVVAALPELLQMACKEATRYFIQ